MMLWRMPQSAVAMKMPNEGSDFSVSVQIKLISYALTQQAYSAIVPHPSFVSLRSTMCPWYITVKLENIIMPIAHCELHQ